MSPWMRGVVLCICAFAAFLWFRDVYLYLRRGSAPVWGRVWTREADPGRFWLIVVGSALGGLVALAGAAVLVWQLLAGWPA